MTQKEIIEKLKNKYLIHDTDEKIFDKKNNLVWHKKTHTEFTIEYLKVKTLSGINACPSKEIKDMYDVSPIALSDRHWETLLNDETLVISREQYDIFPQKTDNYTLIENNNDTNE